VTPDRERSLFSVPRWWAGQAGCGFADPQTIDQLLGAVGLIDIERSHLLVAFHGGHSLRSADAIQLAAALAVDADVMVTYDRELTSAAEREGLRTASPA
jgi:predicted nucleic acid-binding protein